jgi:ABC-2 type transport system permease protein
MSGFYTLLHKELLRFCKVGLQSIFAPMIATLIYLFIFSHILEERAQAYPGVTYTAFLIPGLLMMAMLQNSFANSSSSLIQSKISGSIVFILLSPLSYMEIFVAYVLASIIRGFLVGAGIYLVILMFFDMPLQSLSWVFIFALIGNGFLGVLGIIAAIWAEKFDQLASFQTIHSLPPFWEGLSRFNPFFYVIDGFRYGFFGISDVSPYFSFMIVGICFLAVSWVTLRMLKTGYKLRQ